MTRGSREPAQAPAPPPPDGVDAAPPGRRPVLLAVVCGLVLVQALVAAGMAAAWLADLVRGAVEVPAAAVFLAAFALGVAAVLVLCARGLWAGHRWARSPVMTWQVLLVVMAVGWLQYDAAAWAVAVLGSALVVGVGLLTRPVVRATVDHPDA